jgi:xylulokinase
LNYILGIDIGTSGTKSVLFDASGTVVASNAQEYALHQPFNGWAEQDPADWWRAVCSTCTAVIQQSGVDPAEIAGVGLSGQMHGLVMLDENQRVIRESILWCDQRTGAECSQITRQVGAQRLLEITANPALTGFTASKVLWVRNHEPENFERCRKILLPKDYIRFMLTGEFATDVSDASGMQLLDVGKRCWSEEVLEKLGVDPAWLARVVESVEITGRVTPAAAALTGLAAGTPVVGGAGDNAAAAVGMGVVVDGTAFTTIGTSGVVYAHTSQMKLDRLGRVHTFCSAVPGEWHVMGVTQAAGLSLQWFRNQFCAEERQAAAAQGVDPYDLMNAEAAQIRIGADKLLYLPYLMGERTPHLDPDCRGVFYGLSGAHTRAHLIRAVMEGVTYSLQDCVSILEEMGVGFETMLACGGGGRSPLWRGMLADMFGYPVETSTSSEAPALGAAILAGVGAGLFPSVQAACAQLIRQENHVDPDAERHQEYRRYYALYRRLYPALATEFKTLAQTH